jgi:hypothetical protein
MEKADTEQVTFLLNAVLEAGPSVWPICIKPGELPSVFRNEVSNTPDAAGVALRHVDRGDARPSAMLVPTASANLRTIRKGESITSIRWIACDSKSAEGSSAATHRIAASLKGIPWYHPD